MATNVEIRQERGYQHNNSNILTIQPVQPAEYENSAYLLTKKLVYRKRRVKAHLRNSLGQSLVITTRALTFRRPHLYRGGVSRLM